MKVHEKTTYSSRVNAKTAAMRKIGEESDDEEVEEKKDKDGAIAVKDDPQFTLAITKGLFLTLICLTDLDVFWGSVSSRLIECTCTHKSQFRGLVLMN